MKKTFREKSLLFSVGFLLIFSPLNASAFTLFPDTQVPQGETLQIIIPKYDFTSLSGNFEGKTIPFYEFVQTIDQSSAISRAEFLQLILLNKDYGETVQPEPFFADVPEKSVYYTAIQTAASAGIVSGYEDGLFHPYEKITRGQAAKIIMNAYNPKQITDDVTVFPDVPEDYSLKDYVYNAVRAGVFKGYPDGMMLPDRNISFHESNLIIQRAAYISESNQLLERQAYKAFLGIHRLSATDGKILSINTTDANGNVTQNKSTITVMPQNFAVSRFSLTEDKNKLFGKDYQDNTWQLIDAAKANPSEKQLWEGGFIIPAEGEITLVYGEKLYINGVYSGSHFGIDYANAESTPVLASNNGIVTFAGETPAYGNTIVIDHGQNIYTMYLHLEEAQAQTGVTVKKGDQIGLMGETGIATGPHLHFTHFIGDIIVDSDPWFNGLYP